MGEESQQDLDVLAAQLNELAAGNSPTTNGNHNFNANQKPPLNGANGHRSSDSDGEVAPVVNDGTLLASDPPRPLYVFILLEIVVTVTCFSCH